MKNENMKLRDVMSRDVVRAAPEDSLHSAATKMRASDVGLLPVCEGDQVVGLITDRDITVRAVAEGLDPKHTKVSQVMSSNVVYCFEDEGMDEAVRKMKMNQIRRLPILARDKRLIGVVSLADLAAHGAKDAAADTFASLSEAAAHRGTPR